MTMFADLKGKVALITGAGRKNGLGEAIALRLAAEGCRVVVTDIGAAKGVEMPANAVGAMSEMEMVAAEIAQKTSGMCVAKALDVMEESQVAAVMNAIETEFGGIDILVNNAGIGYLMKPIVDLTVAEFDAVLSVNLRGAFICTKYAAEHMAAAGKGVIINIISTAGHQGEPGNIAYSTCKAGLLNFTRSAAMEFAAAGIRVVSLTPTATDFHEMEERARRWGLDVAPPPGAHEIMDQFARYIPMQKLPKPSDYGAAAVFLASDAAAFITGTDLRVDAGAVGKYWAWDPRNQGGNGST